MTFTRIDRHVGDSGAADNFGCVPMGAVVAGQTVTRCFWGASFSGSASSSSGWPPGSALLRVGLILTTAGLNKATCPTPITQDTDDWMDIVTCRWQGNIAESTNVDWLWYTGVGNPDKQARAQRKNHTANPLQLYVAWESLFAFDTAVSFSFTGTASCDAVLLN